MFPSVRAQFQSTPRRGRAAFLGEVWAHDALGEVRDLLTAGERALVRKWDREFDAWCSQSDRLFD